MKKGVSMALERKNWLHAAGIIWSRLTEAAQQRKTIFYGDISPLISTVPLNVGRALGPIQDYCLETRRPPLTAIVVGKTTGEPGTGFVGWDVGDLASALDLVFDFQWMTVDNPLD